MKTKMIDEEIFLKQHKAGLSQKELAEMAGMEVSQLKTYKSRGCVESTPEKLRNALTKYESAKELARVKLIIESHEIAIDAKLAFFQWHGWVVEISTTSRFYGISFSPVYNEYLLTEKRPCLSKVASHGSCLDLCNELNGLD